MNFFAGKTSPKAAPKPGSWAFAENYVGESEQATQARNRAEQLGVAPIGRGSATALTFLAKVVQAKTVVEVGTGSGVSGLALFAGMQPDGVLTSVDIEPEHQQAAREAFLAIGIPTQRFRLIAGPALSVLPRLSDGAYDMVFVDADKGEYAEYVEESLRLLRRGGDSPSTMRFGMTERRMAATSTPDRGNSQCARRGEGQRGFGRFATSRR